MTREEAINSLANFKRYISGCGVVDRKANEAIDMAIEALKECTDKHTETHTCDYISRQAAIKIFAQLWDCIGTIMDRDEWEDVCKTTANELPSAQQWIPVSSGNLPKVRQRVLCQCRAGIQDVLRLTDDGDWECIHPRTIYMKSFVVAWMPLPEPWTGGDADGT